MSCQVVHRTRANTIERIGKTNDCTSRGTKVGRGSTALPNRGGPENPDQESKKSKKCLGISQQRRSVRAIRHGLQTGCRRRPQDSIHRRRSHPRPTTRQLDGVHQRNRRRSSKGQRHRAQHRSRSPADSVPLLAGHAGHPSTVSPENLTLGGRSLELCGYL